MHKLLVLYNEPKDPTHFRKYYVETHSPLVKKLPGLKASRYAFDHYNRVRPHAALGYKPPAPEVFVPALTAWPAALPRMAPPATLAPKPTLN